MSDKPTCAVQGLIRRGAMCGQIIVGGAFCGYGGKCEHQRPQVLPDDDPMPHGHHDITDSDPGPVA